MKVYKDTSYGADADGNRGITVYDYEIDEYDYHSIYEQIKDQYEPEQDKYYITLICPYTENDIEFLVYIHEELTEKDIVFIELLYMYKEYKDCLKRLGEDCSDYAVQQELIKG
jgi:hypothetical protein